MYEEGGYEKKEVLRNGSINKIVLEEKEEKEEK